MAIAVTCNHCGARLRFKNEHRGRSAKCNACQQPLLVQGGTIPDHDVFISYSSKDKNIADAVCAALEARRIHCWIAPRDIMPGKQWAGAILDAIEETRLMVLIYSASANASPQVIREVDRAVMRNVIIIPFRIEAAEMSKEMQYYISAAHWLDAMDGPMDQHIARLVTTVKQLLAPAAAQSSERNASLQPSSPRSSRWMIWPVALILLLAIVAGLWFLKHQSTILETVAGISPTSAPVVIASPASAPVAKLPPTSSVDLPAGATDLLAAVQLPGDALSQTWSRTADGIHADMFGNGVGKLRLPYQPKGEYDFGITFARQNGLNMVGQSLTYGGRSFEWVMGRRNNNADGFELLDGKLAPENRSLVDVQPAIISGRKYTSVVKVRKDSVSAYVDGKLIRQLKTDYSDLSVGAIFSMGPNCLGITVDNPATIYSAWVLPVSDQLPAIALASQTSSPTTHPQSAPAEQQWVDVLKLANPAQDTAAGTWSINNGELTGKPSQNTPLLGARLELPYEPTLEYELRVSFTSIDKEANVGFICRAADHQVFFGIPAGNNAPSYFSLFTGTSRNRGRVPGPPSQWLYPGRRQVVLITVRKDSIEAHIDGKLACQFNTDFTNLNLARQHLLPHHMTLGLEAGPGAVTFDSIQVLEVSGEGHPLR